MPRRSPERRSGFPRGSSASPSGTRLCRCCVRPTCRRRRASPSRPKADPRARPRRWAARRRAGRARAGAPPPTVWPEMPYRGGREERMKGPRRARMPVYGAGSKYLGCTEKETEWLRFHALQAPGNSHCTPTRYSTPQFPLRPQTPLHQTAGGVERRPRPGDPRLRFPD